MGITSRGPGPAPGRPRYGAIAAVAFVLLLLGVWSGGGTALAAMVPVTDVSASGSAGWPLVQGGPRHLGDAGALAPAPPLRRAWRAPAEPTSISPVVLLGSTAIGVGARQVFGLDVPTGQVSWQIERTSGFAEPAAVDPSAGTGGLIVFTQGGANHTRSSVVAVDGASHQQLWRFPATSLIQQPLRGGPTISDGKVFVGGQDGVLYAIDEASGQLAWQHQTGGSVQTAPAVDRGTVFAVSENVSTGRVNMMALDAATGKKVRWSYAPSGTALHSSAPTVADGRVYVGFGDGSVRAFDEASGVVVWSSPVLLTAAVRGVFAPTNLLAYADGDLFVADANGGLFRLNGATGAKVWDYQFTSSSVNGAPLVAGPYVYLGHDDGTLTAFDASNGDLVWRTSVGDVAVGALTPSGDLLLVPSVGRQAGLLAAGHIAGPLVRVPSTTRLHVGVALANFAIAFVIVLGVLLLLFGWTSRRRARREQSDGPQPSPEAELADVGADGRDA